MTEQTFALPGSSYEEVAKIIRSYGSFPEPAGPAEVAGRIGTHPTIVSRNNKFLLNIKVVEGGNKKVLTDTGRRLAQALEHEMPDEITRYWRNIVENSDFLQSILAAVKIRKGMDPAALAAHIAYSAGAAKTKDALVGARTVVEILRAAGTVSEQDGKYVQVATAQGTPSSGDVWHVGEVPAEESEGVAATTGILLEKQTALAPVTIRVNVEVTCKADELEALGEHLKALLASLSTTAED